MLYDEDIISEHAFCLWQTTDREEGHGISVLSLKAFFEWLDEAEATEPWRVFKFKKKIQKWQNKQVQQSFRKL